VDFAVEVGDDVECSVHKVLPGVDTEAVLISYNPSVRGSGSLQGKEHSQRGYAPPICPPDKIRSMCLQYRLSSPLSQSQYRQIRDGRYQRSHISQMIPIHLPLEDGSIILQPDISQYRLQYLLNSNSSYDL